MDDITRANLNKVIEKATKDKSFREKLMQSTRETLKEEGVKLEQSHEFKIVQNTKKDFYFVVPSQKTALAAGKQKIPRNPSFTELALWTIYQVQENTSYKERLFTNPNQVLKELGVELPGNPKVHVLQNTDLVRHVVIPSNIDSHEALPEHELEQVSGGKGFGGSGPRDVGGSGFGGKMTNDDRSNLDSIISQHGLGDNPEDTGFFE